MLRTPDYLILQVFSQVIEIITVPGHTYYKITVKLGMFLSLAKSLSIDDIKLYMMSVKAEITPDQCCELLIAPLILKELR